MHELQKNDETDRIENRHKRIVKREICSDCLTRLNSTMERERPQRPILRSLICFIIITILFIPFTVIIVFKAVICVAKKFYVYVRRELDLFNEIYEEDEAPVWDEGRLYEAFIKGEDVHGHSKKKNNFVTQPEKKKKAGIEERTNSGIAMTSTSKPLGNEDIFVRNPAVERQRAPSRLYSGKCTRAFDFKSQDCVKIDASVTSGSNHQVTSVITGRNKLRAGNGVKNHSSVSVTKPAPLCSTRQDCVKSDASVKSGSSHEVTSVVTGRHKLRAVNGGSDHSDASVTKQAPLCAKSQDCVKIDASVTSGSNHEVTSVVTGRNKLRAVNGGSDHSDVSATKPAPLCANSQDCVKIDASVTSGSNHEVTSVVTGRNKLRAVNGGSDHSDVSLIKPAPLCAKSQDCVKIDASVSSGSNCQENNDIVTGDSKLRADYSDASVTKTAPLGANHPCSRVTGPSKVNKDKRVKRSHKTGRFSCRVITPKKRTQPASDECLKETVSLHPPAKKRRKDIPTPSTSRKTTKEKTAKKNHRSCTKVRRPELTDGELRSATPFIAQPESMKTSKERVNESETINAKLQLSVTPFNAQPAEEPMDIDQESFPTATSITELVPLVEQLNLGPSEDQASYVPDACDSVSVDPACYVPDGRDSDLQNPTSYVPYVCDSDSVDLVCDAPDVRDCDLQNPASYVPYVCDSDSVDLVCDAPDVRDSDLQNPASYVPDVCDSVSVDPACYVPDVRDSDLQNPASYVPYVCDSVSVDLVCDAPDVRDSDLQNPACYVPDVSDSDSGDDCEGYYDLYPDLRSLPEQVLQIIEMLP